MKDTQSLHHVFILMGVSGSGKSAVANGVAQRIGAAFLDGDFLHPRANITKMASGHALMMKIANLGYTLSMMLLLQCKEPIKCH